MGNDEDSIYIVSSGCRNIHLSVAGSRRRGVASPHATLQGRMGQKITMPGYTTHLAAVCRGAQVTCSIVLGSIYGMLGVIVGSWVLTEGNNWKCTIIASFVLKFSAAVSLTASPGSLVSSWDKIQFASSMHCNVIITNTLRPLRSNKPHKPMQVLCSQLGYIRSLTLGYMACTTCQHCKVLPSFMQLQ